MYMISGDPQKDFLLHANTTHPQIIEALQTTKKKKKKK